MFNVTLVGFGHYAAMIAPKYEKHEHFSVKAVISPNSSSPYKTVTSVEAWKLQFGTAQESDVFDLCVHTKLIVPIAQELVAIGATKFILPKPTALSAREAKQLREVLKNCDVFVASQWRYATIVQEISEIISSMEKVTEVAIDFSQRLADSQLENYSSYSCLLPHMVEILDSCGLLKDAVIDEVEFTKTRIGILCTKGETTIRLHSSIVSDEKRRRMSVVGTRTLGVNFLGEHNEGKLQAAYQFGKDRKDIEQDVLDAMLTGAHIHFSGEKQDYSTVESFMLQVQSHIGKHITVIGGGLFGVMSAIQLTKKGYNVTILEKSTIGKGATFVNQSRNHMGYHYPRSVATIKEVADAQVEFAEWFDKTIVSSAKNFYLLAKEGSKTSKDDFIRVCDENNLPYELTWPQTPFVKEKIAVSMQVPEKIFDQRVVVQEMYRMIEENDNITLFENHEVTGIDPVDSVYEITCAADTGMCTFYSGVILNATYSHINVIHDMLGLECPEYQYELVEEPIVTVPWQATEGFAIMDGPFFGLVPMGDQGDYIFYDVDLSVLERTTGKFPKFKKSYDEYKESALARFPQYLEKAKEYIPEVVNCTYQHSLFVTRIVLPHRDHDDSRPTLVLNPRDGFWTVLSGKVCTCTVVSEEVASAIDSYLKD